MYAAAGAASSTMTATLHTLLNHINLGPAANEKKTSSLGESRPSSSCPVEWFVADDAATATRYFVIQGSESFESWITNLTFDPAVFEDPAMGVKIHKGVYNAALALYDTFLPLVVDHVADNPVARVCFTGHSLGGALATALMLMYRHRGVLPVSSILPVYTFGGAAVFCDSGCGDPETLCNVGSSVEPGSAEPETEGQTGCNVSILRKLGLHDGIVRNVVMTRDIVPRAFTCDYTPVREILRNMHVSFREHGCLNHMCETTGKVRLYQFLGRIMVVQPPTRLRFVRPGEGNHPLLPDAAGIFEFRKGRGSKPRGGNLDTLRYYATSMASLDGAAASASLSSMPPPGAHMRAYRDPGSVSVAVHEFMDYPHPLEILRDPAAYGSDGVISRYHNPDSYTVSLGSLLHERSSRMAARFQDLKRRPTARPGGDLHQGRQYGPTRHRSMLEGSISASAGSIDWSLDSVDFGDDAASSLLSMDQEMPSIRPPERSTLEEHLQEAAEREAAASRAAGREPAEGLGMSVLRTLYERFLHRP